MRLKINTHTERYYVYDCPLCGEETRLYSGFGEYEGKPCERCLTALQTLKKYEEFKFLLGAVITDITVSSDEFESFIITTKKGERYRLESDTDFDGIAEIGIVPIP